MFQVDEWPTKDEDNEFKFPQLDSPSVGPKRKKKKKNKKVDKIVANVQKHVDRRLNSPGLSQNLIESDDGEEVLVAAKKKSLKPSTGSTSSLTSLGDEVGSLLRKGIRFASEADFVAFMTAKKSKHKKKKRKADGEDAEHDGEEERPVRKKAKKFDVDKLKSLFDTEGDGAANDEKGGEQNRHVSKLKSSHFRHLNERLNSQTGAQSLKMFRQDPGAFKIYHEGFQEQVSKWPMDPINVIIAAVMKAPGTPVVADFGCGEARLARALADGATVHSFDLVKVNDLVTVCDFSRTPLHDESCDIAVFCLSLMGTNLRDFFKEANRVLKPRGTLKIAEVASRFQDCPPDEFIALVERYGFKLKWKDLSKEYFYFMDLTKVDKCKKKVPDITLKPCIYKRR